MLLAVEMQERKKRTCGKFMHNTTIKQQADFKLQIDQKFQQPQKGNSVNIVAISQGYAIHVERAIDKITRKEKK